MAREATLNDEFVSFRKIREKYAENYSCYFGYCTTCMRTRTFSLKPCVALDAVANSKFELRTHSRACRACSAAAPVAWAWSVPHYIYTRQERIERLFSLISHQSYLLLTYTYIHTIYDAEWEKSRKNTNRLRERSKP